MPAVLVSDTSILIDLERGQIIAAAFRVSYEIVVPDILYERELSAHGGSELLDFGLKVLALHADGVMLTQRYRHEQRLLSLPDAMALALAKTNNYTLLTGDASLRSLAYQECVECHGLLWFFDIMETEGILDAAALYSALDRIANHPRCRLPRDEIATRLARYKPGAK